MNNSESREKFIPADSRSKTSPSKLEINTDYSLDKLIDIVNQWMVDESEYDEKNYPEIEVALKQNRLSI